MALERMGVQPFHIEEVGTSPGPSSNPRRYTSNGKRRPAPRRDVGKGEHRFPVGLVAKLGICVIACGLMLGLKELDTPIAAEMVSGVKNAVNEETDLTEMLGKLQFVELPNAVEVFSADNSKMAVPVNAPQMVVEPEAQYVMWEGAPNAVVVASAAGEVRALGEDNILGPYVRLSHKDDLETIYYGLSTIMVEAGQPVRKNDTLGVLGESGVLRLHVLLAGKPQPPEDYMELVVAE